MCRSCLQKNALVDSLDRPNHSCRCSTNLVSISPPSWSKTSSGLKQRFQLRYSRSSTLSWMRQCMTHATLSSKSRWQLLHQHRRSLHLHHYDHHHLHYKHPGRIAGRPRLKHPLRARAREQTEPLPHSPGNTFASRNEASSPFLRLRIHSSSLPIMSK